MKHIIDSTEVKEIGTSNFGMNLVLKNNRNLIVNRNNVCSLDKDQHRKLTISLSNGCEIQILNIDESMFDTILKICDEFEYNKYMPAGSGKSFNE